MNLEKLVIYRPQSQSAAQRWTSTALTTLAWGLVFYGFFPLAGFVIGRRALPALPFEHNVTSMGAWGSLVPLLPWWALSVVILLGLLYVWATVQFLRFRHTRRKGNAKRVSTREMAEHCKHPEQAVRSWGGARRSVAHYDSQAAMVRVGTQLDEPFREVPRAGEPSAPTAPLAAPMSVRKAAKLRQQRLERDAAKLRDELVAYWGRVESLEALMRDVAENSARRDNNRDVVLYAQLKESFAALVALIKDRRRQLAETRFALEELNETLRALNVEPAV